jgi:hypothetical protein
MITGLKAAFAATGIVMVAVAATPANAQFGNFLNQLQNQNQQQRTPSQSGAPPASQLQSGSGGGGASLGTDAVAVIEDIEGANSPKQFMDYLFAGDAIQLGPKGKLQLSYMSGCLIETITGGSVTIQPNAATGANPGALVSGGNSQKAQAPNCKPQKVAMASTATEAGATANRLSTLFDSSSWEERVVNSLLPVFKWGAGSGPVTVTVNDEDAEPKKPIWQAQASKDFIEYPKNAPAL